MGKIGKISFYKLNYTLLQLVHKQWLTHSYWKFFLLELYTCSQTHNIQDIKQMSWYKHCDHISCNSY